jgi:hypothetical protein
VSFEECPNCGTGQLQHEQYWGCLCSIICDVELTTEERIIKLLEADCHSYDGTTHCPCGAVTPEQVDYVIALIKGENK